MACEITFYFFVIGFLFLLHEAWVWLKVLGRIYFGTKVTPSIYGKESWALVTGATDGIGKQLCFDLAKAGFHIVLVARNPEKLSNTALEI